jgi:ABC-type antimicrobial peptide transport system permease subunit
MNLLVGLGSDVRYAMRSLRSRPLLVLVAVAVLALGARGADVMALVLGQGLRPVLVGLGMGLAASLALGGALSTLLFGVAPHDATTMAWASAVLAAVAAVACYLPARRAARMDPATALRRE